jgi:hypothetical protein
VVIVIAVYICKITRGPKPNVGHRFVQVMYIIIQCGIILLTCLVSRIRVPRTLVLHINDRNSSWTPEVRSALGVELR